MPGFDYRIVSDGGSRRNGSPDSWGYGSYQLKTRTGQTFTKRLDFGRGITNNTAEYKALYAALTDLVDRITTAGKDPAAFTVICYTDSRLVVDQLSGQAKVKARHIKQHWAGCTAKIGRFGQVIMAWTERSDIVAILGH